MGMMYEYASPIGTATDEFAVQPDLAESRATQIINELEELVADIRKPKMMVSNHEIAVRLYHFIHNGCR